ncbi:MAG: hypothetical protein VCB25_10615 [Myxococcota bacterium]
MVYVLAAYSITIGTLMFYGVILQHRRRLVELDLARPSRPMRSIEFNLGVALLSPFWMWQHGMRAAGTGRLILYLTMLPLYDQQRWILLLFVAMVPLAAGTALGFVGHRIARNDRSSESPAEYWASQLPWSLAGVGLYSVILPWFWYFRFAAA